MLFDLAGDIKCKENIWQQQSEAGEMRKEKARSVISLSQKLMYENRVFPLLLIVSSHNQKTLPESL